MLLWFVEIMRNSRTELFGPIGGEGLRSTFILEKMDPKRVQRDEIAVGEHETRQSLQRSFAILIRLVPGITERGVRRAQLYYLLQ